MTTQIQSTMIQTCRILFKTRAENFELLPSGGYGTWGFYTEYLGLHYYLMVIDTTRSNTIYDTSNTENYEYNAVRTNYKIQDLIMVPSECVEPDDEINFEDIIDPKCHNSGDTWKTDVNEKLFICKNRSHLYERDENGIEFYHVQEITEEQHNLSYVLPEHYHYVVSSIEGFHEKYFGIIYNEPDLPSISRETFKSTIEQILSSLTVW
jgi:hypothetical protein